MSTSSIPTVSTTHDEEARLRELTTYRVAGSGPEAQFDEITNLVSGMFNAPMAIVSLVDRDKQWLKARAGLKMIETPRTMSFCAHTIMTDNVLVVADTRKDKRFVDNPLVTSSPHIRFYAGAPLVTKNGFRLGALCVLDTQPRQNLDRRQEELLRNFADFAMTHLVLRREKLTT